MRVKQVDRDLKAQILSTFKSRYVRSIESLLYITVSNDIIYQLRYLRSYMCWQSNILWIQFRFRQILFMEINLSIEISEFH